MICTSWVEGSSSRELLGRLLHGVALTAEVHTYLQESCGGWLFSGGVLHF